MTSKRLQDYHDKLKELHPKRKDFQTEDDYQEALSSYRHFVVPALRRPPSKDSEQQ